MTLVGQEQLSRRAFFRGNLISETSRDAAQWRLIEGPFGGPSEVFWSSWADEVGTLIAGDDGIILHHDGAGWTRQTSPAPVPIHGLWGRARDDLWAVGWMGVILHHDGSGWHKVRGCVCDESGKYASCDENTPLFAIAGRKDGTAWAVGDRGIVLQYDGTTWQTENAGTRSHLRAVSCLVDGRVLAAGGDGCILIRDLEGTWSRLENPHRTNFTAVLALDDGTILLAGGRYFAADNGFRGDLLLLNGEQFTPLFQNAGFSRFRALARHGGDVIAVGDAGQIHRLRNGQIDRLASGTTYDLLCIMPLPNGGTLAVGDFGTVLTCDNPGKSDLASPAYRGAEIPLWESVESGSDRQLWGLWADPDSGQLHACGEEGTVLIHDRGKWEKLPPVGDLGLHTLNRAPDGGLLAAGQLGEIHHFDGSQWRMEFDLHMDVTILSLWSDGAGNLFAAGDEGLVLQRSAGSEDWIRMPGGTKSALYGLWGIDHRHLLAVGDFGLILRWNGTRWDEFNAGTEHFLFDVWGRGLDDIYVVGLSGTIGHFDGRRWTITPVRARVDLLALAGGAQDVVAVGAAGAVFRHDGRNWAPEASGTTAGLRAVALDPDGTYVAAGDQGLLLVRKPDSLTSATIDPMKTQQKK